GGRAALRVDRVHLAQVAALVGAERPFDRGGGRQALLQQIEHGRSQVAVGERLRRHGAHAGSHERAAGADGECPRRHRHRKGTSGRLVGYDRPGHFFSMFQNTTLVATRTPVMFLRNADGCRYWPSTMWVGYSAARAETAAAICFCCAGSVSRANASRSRSISLSQGQPKVALSQ